MRGPTISLEAERLWGKDVRNPKGLSVLATTSEAGRELAKTCSSHPKGGRVVESKRRNEGTNSVLLPRKRLGVSGDLPMKEKMHGKKG